MLNLPACVLLCVSGLCSHHCCADKGERLHPGPEKLPVPQQHPRGGAPLLPQAFAQHWGGTDDPAAPLSLRALQMTPGCVSADQCVSHGLFAFFPWMFS